MEQNEELQKLRNEKDINNILKAEREISNFTYAKKIVEPIVLGFVAILLTVFAYGIINLLIESYAKR